MHVVILYDELLVLYEIILVSVKLAVAPARRIFIYCFASIPKATAG